MSLDDQLISSFAFWLALLACVTCSLVAIRYAPWNALLERNERQHLFFASLVFLPLFWLLNVYIQDQVVIHLMGVTAITLMLGWSLAVVVGLFAQAAYWGVGQVSLYGLPVSMVFSVLLPATVTYLLFWWVSRARFKNLFAYMLGVGFAGGVLSVLSMAGLLYIGASVSADGPLAQWAETSFPFVLMLGFPEGFINGTVVTALTVFYPDLMKTFDDDWYLRR